MFWLFLNCFSGFDLKTLHMLFSKLAYLQEFLHVYGSADDLMFFCLNVSESC